MSDNEVTEEELIRQIKEAGTCTCPMYGQGMTDEPCEVHGEERPDYAIKKRERLDRAGEGLCAQCGKRKSTERFSSSGGALDFSHGFYEMWCRLCVAYAQLEYAEEAASRVDDLKGEIKKLEGETSP